MITPPVFANLEAMLPGTLLHGRWLVGNPTKRTPGQTGGCFSITFECTDQNSKKPVFLKVVDVNSAIMSYSQTMSIPDIMIKIADEHNFESSLMDECKESNLRRVVVGLDHGSVQIPAFTGPVLFLVFELASGDTHKVRSITPALANGLDSDKWWLETLHHVTTGLHQLHQKAIAHQDVKPSNILFFDQMGAKVADLGRAVKKGAPSSNLRKNGDPIHSPPELFFGVRPAEWGTRYLAVDLYMLGNLLYFHFSGGMTATCELLNRLEPTFNPFSGYKGTFQDAVPALEDAFGRVLVEFRNSLVNHLPAKIADELTSILKELCQPDPEKRGHPKDRQTTHGQKFSTYRYINRFNRARLLLA
jgi:serine/threonine protein kinase